MPEPGTRRWPAEQRRTTWCEIDRSVSVPEVNSLHVADRSASLVVPLETRRYACPVVARLAVGATCKPASDDFVAATQLYG
jgi:hypothetical protein